MSSPPLSGVTLSLSFSFSFLNTIRSRNIVGDSLSLFLARFLFCMFLHRIVFVGTTEFLFFVHFNLSKDVQNSKPGITVAEKIALIVVYRVLRGQLRL